MNWNKMRQYILPEVDGDWAGRDYLEGKGERESEIMGYVIAVANLQPSINNLGCDVQNPQILHHHSSLPFYLY